MKTSLVILTALFMCIGLGYGEECDAQFADMWGGVKCNDGFALHLKTYDCDHKTIARDGVLTADFLAGKGSDKVIGTRTFNISKKDYAQINERAIPMFNVPARKHLEWESEKIRYDELPEGMTVRSTNLAEWPMRCTFEEPNGNKIKVVLLNV